SEATYREIFENNPQPMLVCHRESLRFLAVNQAALELYGYRRDEFLKLSLRALEVVGTDPAAPVAGRSVSRHRNKAGIGLDLELVWQTLHFKGESAYLAVLHQAGEQGRAALEHRV